MLPLLLAAASPGASVAAESRVASFSHGPDPIPSVDLVAGASLGDPGVACVGPDEAHLRTLYALPRDASAATIALSPAQIALSEAAVRHANAILYANAQEHGVALRLKALCDEDGSLAIEPVTLELSRTQVHFWAMVWELEARGFGGPHEKVLIFYDGGWTTCGCGGWASIPGGDEPGPDNPNNHGYGSYAGIFMGNYGATAGWAMDEVVLHEVTHMMGGVQMSAPHSSGGWHCNDGWDIMCYADGGSSSAYANTCFPVGQSSVGLAQPYDCGNDDYFHPSPAPGSYLDTHWNVGAEYNRFLARG